MVGDLEVTEGDRIRQMDDVELANYFCEMLPYDSCWECQFSIDGKCYAAEFLKHETGGESDQQ